MAVTVRVYDRFEDLPAGYDALFAAAGRQSYGLGQAWFELLFGTCFKADNRLRLYGVEHGEAGAMPSALLIAYTSSEPGAPRKLAGLANYFSPEFAPLVAPPPSDHRGGGHAADLTAIASTIRHETPRWESIQFAPVCPAGPAYEAFIAGLQGQFQSVKLEPQPGDWYEPFDGASFEDYWQGLSSKRRNTLKRREKAARRTHEIDIRLFRDTADIETAIAAYRKIYANSWKPEERFPDFIPDVIRLAARYGTLRLGIVYVNGEPAAAELGILADRVAFMMKTAYDTQYRDLSVGVIAIKHVLEHILDNDAIVEFDFGNGDDAYKTEWVSTRRDRMGVVAFNTRTLKGALRAAKAVGSQAARSLRGAAAGAAARNSART